METTSRTAVRSGPTWARSRDLAPSWVPPTVPTVFVVPHPDDEVLMMGGLLARQLDGDQPVTVVAVTDGEAAYPSRPAAPLADARRREQRLALSLLAGSPDRRPEVVRLGLPDGDVAGNEPELARALGALVGRRSLVVAPWAHDHHCDHEAVGRAAAIVAAERSAVLASGLFWAWWRTPPVTGLRRLAVPDGHRARRRAAVGAHRTQLIGPTAAVPPVLADPDLAPLAWRHEYYFVGTP